MKMKRLISLILVVVIMSMMCVSGIVYAGAKSAIEYTFLGDESNARGYAQGELSYTASADGTYCLYWADDSKALVGYFEITSFTLKSGEKGSVTFKEQTAIPVGAKKIIATTAETCDNALVSNASAVYDIPSSKLLNETESDKRYSFAAFSDIHIDMQGGGFDTYYINAKPHFENALQKCVEKNVDFIVAAGDQVTNASGTTLEWLTYQKTIADSNYTNPIYECIGNHETRYSKYTDCSIKCGLEEFSLATGLDKDAKNVESVTPYYEYTQESTGDHFIFLALENGTDASLCDEFSDNQIAWLTDLLQKYDGDGHKIYLIEHSPFYAYGAGDYNDDPAYEGSLRLESEEGETFKNNVALKNLIEEYKDVIWLSGHTHVDFRDDVNYSDENGTSCHMLHIPSCANTTRIKVDETGDHYLDREFFEDTTQGYFADSYDDIVIFKGTNLYYDKIYPLYTYIMGETETPEPTTEEPTTVEPTTAEPTTEPTTAEPTTAEPTTAEPTTAEPTTVEPTTIEPTTAEPTTTEPTVEPTTQESIKYGDVDGNGLIEIIDVTLIQRHLSHLIQLNDDELKRARVDGMSTLNIADATYIQRYLAKLIDKFPVEEMLRVSAKKADDFAQTGATAEELSKTQEKSKGYLDAYYQYASYNAYQALHKEYVKYGTLDASKLSSSEIERANNALNSAIDGFDSLHERVWADTVYFSDVNDMGNVRAYSFTSSGKYMEPWPGQKATYMATNSLGQNIYAVTVNYARYKTIIFSNENGIQTEDISINGKSGTVYYPENAESPYKVGKSTYKKMWYEEQVPIKDINIYFTNTQSWSKVNCYYWTDSSLGKWPGSEMEFVRTSSSGKGIYKMTIPENVSGVIFNGGSSGPQTVDVTDIQDGYGYYPSELDSSGKWKVTQYVYG